MSVVHFVLVDFGGGSCSSSCCSCCCSCDRGKTKSTPCLTWTELLSLDWSLTTKGMGTYSMGAFRATGHDELIFARDLV